MSAPQATLAKRPLGKTGLAVSEIGFGGWGIGKAMWGRTDDAESLKALRAALELGVDYFDTARAYGRGHSERLIAQALREWGRPAVVATKVPPKNMEWPAHPRTRLEHAFPPDWVLSCAEQSLRDLRVPVIDLLQLHVWTDAWLKDPLWPRTLEAVARLKREGRIRFFGASLNSDDPDTGLELVRSGAVDAVQVILNVFDRRAAERLLPACRAGGVGVVVRCPFDEGSLTGVLTPQTRFEPEDFRSYYFGGERLAETCARVARLKEAVGPRAATLAEAALKFCLSFPEVSTVIPGMRTRAHVEANARAADGRYFDARFLEELRAHAWVRNFYV